MISIQLDETILTNAIATAVAAAMYPKTEATEKAQSPSEPVTKSPSHPKKQPAHSYAYKIEKMKRNFAEHSRHTPPEPTDVHLYETWVRIFGYKPVTAAEFLDKARKHSDEITITTFLRSANKPAGVGLKLSEYAAHHSWLKKVTSSGNSAAVYGVPKPPKNYQAPLNSLFN